MEEFSSTKRIKPWPPRGMMTSISVSSFSMAVTAARSVVAMMVTAAFGQAGFFQAGLDHGAQRHVAVQGFRAATQDGGVAGLQAQAGRIHRHVGPGFVEDANLAQGGAHLAQLQAIGQLFGFHNRSGS